MSIPLDKLTFLQQVWSISGEIRASTRKPHWLLGKSVRRRHLHCSSWNTLDNCPIKIPSQGIISYSQTSIARRKPGRRYLKSAFIRDIQLMNDSPVSWSRHSPGSWREGEREWTILRSFPVFELILYLQGRHEYSSKHSSSLFNKRYLCQHTRHSCFNCSIRVEMNRQQLLGVAREVQSFSSPSLNNR